MRVGVLKLEIMYSDEVIKLNSLGLKQKRDMVLTTKNIYNLKNMSRSFKV